VRFQVFTCGALRAFRLWSFAVVAALALSAGAVLAGTATARSGHAVRRGIRARGLTAAERRAITIKSVRAVGDPSVGLVVTATFTGNIERYLGEGNLSNGLLALVLVPSSSTQASNGLLDQGGGLVTTPFPALQRSGERLTAKLRTVDIAGRESVRTVLPGGQATVIRANNQVVFDVSGAQLAGIAKIKVEVFAARPGGGNQLPGIAPTSVWNQVLDATPTALGTSATDMSSPTPAQLAAFGKQLSGVATRGIRPQLRRLNQARGRLTSAIARSATLGPLAAKRPGLPGLSEAALIADLVKTTARIDYLNSEIADLGKLAAQIQPLIEASRLPPTVAVVQTAPGLSQFMSSQSGLRMSTFPPAGVPVITVNDAVRYQRFSGIGAAMTDSSAWLIYNQLSPGNSLALMQALFGPPGVPNPLRAPAIHLNFLRVAIGGSGAMTVGAPYSYDDMPPGQTDRSLSNFSIARDFDYMLPTLQQALTVNPGLQILANPWSPPGWMKTNDSLDNVGALGRLLPSAYGPLADYFVKFIQAYQNNGVPISAITPENEPSSGQVATAYPGLTLPEPDSEQLISQYLAPALREAGLNTKIYGDDFGWDTTSYATSLSSGPAAGDLAGLAWHCYFGSPTAMTQLHRLAPALDQIVDECSPEIRTFGTPEFLISSLRNWASIVSVWSVALDPSGGPIQPSNHCPGCMGPVTINEETHGVSFRPEYYQLGQVSAFVQPGAVRIDSPNFARYGVNASNIETVAPGLDDVAFLNPDGSKVLVAYNNSGNAISFAVASDGRYFTYGIPARAMTTFVWDRVS
jgi:glucosylceramidase